MNECLRLIQQVPDNLTGIRKLGELREEKIESCTGYSSDPSDSCTAHNMSFPGLNIVAVKDWGKTYPVAVEVSNKKWHLLQHIRVGQSLESLEHYYGIKIPRKTSPIELAGKECGSVIIWHSGIAITKVSLPCHACD